MTSGMITLDTIDNLERNMALGRAVGNRMTPVHNHILARLIAAYRELHRNGSSTLTTPTHPIPPRVE